MKVKGFTMVELAVAAAVIGLLSAIAISRFTGVMDSAKVANVQENLASMRIAIGMYHSQTGEFPRESQIIRHNNGEGPDLTMVFYPPIDHEKADFYLSDFLTKDRFQKTPSFYSRNTTEIYEVASVVSVGSSYRSGGALYPHSPDSGIGGWIYREDDGAIRAFLAKGAYNNPQIVWSEF